MEDHKLHCTLLPPSLQWLLNQSPAFPINSQQVSIISKPEEFYKELIDKAKTARTRITLASLYLGNGKLEKSLVDAIGSRLHEHPQLKVQWLLDYTRGSRQPNSSRSMLQPLVQYENCTVSLFHTPELRGFLKWLLPQRWNETVALQHMKLYIYDDTLLISGANLSNDYFTNRQDRYWVISDAKELCDFLQLVVTAVAQHSFILKSQDTTSLHPLAQHHPYESNYKEYCAAVERSIRRIWEDEMERSVHRIRLLNDKLLTSQCTSVSEKPNQQSLPSFEKQGVLLKSTVGPQSSEQHFARRRLHSDGHKETAKIDTLVFPTLQMKSFNINYDSVLTKRLLTSTVGGSTVHLASGYFNLTNTYMDCVLGATHTNYSILCAHPKANGFLGAKGLAGAIPAAYTHILKEFMKRVTGSGRDKTLEVLEYERDGWTFHAKGLWYTLPNQAKPCLSIIGSPNFGWRSVDRDLESQLVVVTASDSLKQRLLQERSHLYGPVTRVSNEETFAHHSRYVKLWVRCVVPIIKRFF